MQGTIYHPVTPVQAIEHVISKTSSSGSTPLTIVVVCCSRGDFERQLVQSIVQQPDASRGPSSEAPANLWSLSTLFASTAIRLAFCDSTAALYAYLSTLRKISTEARHATPAARPCLYILNPILLHRESTSYSAQGLGETFAAALDASWRTGRALIIFEPVDPLQSSSHNADLSSSPIEPDATAPHLEQDGMESLDRRQRDQNPWDAEVPIVNSSTRSFGADRARMARTTKIRNVAARWCIFKSMPQAQ